MKKLIVLLLTTMLVAASMVAQAASMPTGTSSSGSSSGSKGGSANCHGRFFNPLSDTNWDDMFPITIMGYSLDLLGTGNSNPPIMYEPMICFCPSDLFGMTLPGIGITYWEPLYVAEVTKSPGCLITLGGKSMLSGYSNEQGPAKGSNASSGDTGDRSQMHWYVYPLFGLIDAELSSVCKNSSQGFDLVGITEINPIWQNDIWSAVFSPESSLFANIPMQLACVVDAVTSTFHYPLDPLFWCAGTWGSVYPLSGNPNTKQSDQQGNALILAKYIAWQARLGLLLTTVGPQAECFASYSPIWIKSQFRVDPIWPLPNYYDEITVGESPVRWGYMPPGNFPLNQDSAYLIWNGEQCCLRY